MMLVPKRNSFDLLDGFFDEDDLFPKKYHELMKTDIKEKKDKYVIEIDLPGFDKHNLNITLNNGYLNITGKVSREENKDKDEKYVHRERFYGECKRSFYVGDDIKEEDIEAEFKNGILIIDIPKKEEIKKTNESKQIFIK